MHHAHGIFDGHELRSAGFSIAFSAPEAYESTSAAAVRGSIDYLDQHFYEAQRIEDMAERCYLSPRRFTALFKAQTGLTFSHYLNQLRVEYAQQRLQQTGHILYACYESGFNAPAYFYRVFKKHTGQTPGQYLSDLERWLAA